MRPGTGGTALCGSCGHRRYLHCGPTWPEANGACLMCPTGCKRFVAVDARGASPANQGTARPRSRE